VYVLDIYPNDISSLISERPKVVSAEISADISAEISAETEISAMPAETETEIHPFLKGEFTF
jgi:hypothetical protein